MSESTEAAGPDRITVAKMIVKLEQMGKTKYLTDFPQTMEELGAALAVAKNREEYLKLAALRNPSVAANIIANGYTLNEVVKVVDFFTSDEMMDAQPTEGLAQIFKIAQERGLGADEREAAYFIALSLLQGRVTTKTAQLGENKREAIMERWNKEILPVLVKNIPNNSDLMKKFMLTPLKLRAVRMHMPPSPASTA